MNSYNSIADDFYVNMQLQTTMDLPQSRDSLLHFFEQVQRRFPKMRNLTTRERETFLEEDKEDGTYRWVSADARKLSSGIINPNSFEDSTQLHAEVLSIIPYSLSISHHDCESLNLVYGFDFTYRGNHNLLLAETLGLPPAFDELSEIPGCQILGYEPSLQITLDGELRTQCRLSFETRTLPFSMRTGDYPEEQLSVYLALRRVDSLLIHEKFESEIERLAEIGRGILDSYVVGNILRPLQKAISNH